MNRQIHRAAGGEHLALFIFDGIRNTLISRAAGGGVDLDSHLEAGKLPCNGTWQHECDSLLANG